MILVVDDHLDTRSALVRLLRCQGYEAVAVADGYEALGFLRANSVRLVVLDFHMPDLDGFGVLRSIRGDPMLCDVPVLMLSADDSERRRDESLRLGAREFIVKGSTDWPALFALIQQCAGRANGDVE